MALKLYKLERPDDHGYDEADALVVCASSKARARMIHPNPKYNLDKWDGISDGTWVDSDEVIVTYLGKAAYGMKPGIVLVSFNAG